MKILYLHQYFKIPAESAGTRSYWIALELIKEGHSVIMVTSRNVQNELIEEKMIDGIDLIYIRNSYSSDMSVTRRLVSFFIFMVAASFIALRQRGIDLVYATSTPLSVGVPALITRFFKRIPFIFEVRDLWPEFPFQMGAVKNKLSKYILKSYEKRIYEKAIHIIALSPGMKDGIVSTGVDPAKVTVIPNMSKTDKFYPRKPDHNIMSHFGLSPGKFKVIHFGAMGLANGLEYLIDAAKIMKEKRYDNIEIIILGDGMVKSALQKEVQKYNLSDIVIFIEYQPMDLTSEIVNCCDCSVVTFKNLPVLQTNSPNKLFDSLSAAKPVIVNSAGWTKQMVESNQCGLYANPEKPSDFVDAVLLLKNNKDLAQRMGTNSRMLAKKKYNKSILCNELVQVIEKYYIPN